MMCSPSRWWTRFLIGAVVLLSTSLTPSMVIHGRSAIRVEQPDPMDAVDSMSAQAATSGPILGIYAFAFDSVSSIAVDLAATTTPALESLVDASRAYPGLTALAVVDRPGIGDTEIYSIMQGVLTPVVGLPDANGILDPVLREYDMANGTTLGGFLRWARNRVPGPAFFSYIGHGAPLAPETDLGQIFPQPHRPIADNISGIPLPSRVDANAALTDEHPRGLLSPYDLRIALAQGTQEGTDPFTVVDLIHCFSASIEELTDIAPYAKTLVAAPNYTYFTPAMPGATLRAIASSPTAEAAATQIIQAYHTMLAGGTNPHMLVAVRGDAIPPITQTWARIAQLLLEELARDPITTRQRIRTAYEASAKYDTTYCETEQTDLGPPDALSDLDAFAAQLGLHFDASMRALTDLLQTQITAAIIGRAVDASPPWFMGPIAPTWRFPGAGLSIYTDFAGDVRAGTRYLSWHAHWYTDTVTLDNPHPYTFLKNNVWDSVLSAYWQGTPVQTAVCLPLFPVNGGIHNDTVWRAANSPYVIMGNIVVFPGAHLTIEPGVEVRFADRTGLTIRGAVTAIGTPTAPITFTAASTTPQPESWSQIYVDTERGGALDLHFATIEYAGTGLSFATNGLTPDTSITDSLFQHNLYAITGRSAPPVERSTFRNNDWGIMGSESAVRNSRFENNRIGISSEDITVTTSWFSGHADAAVMGSGTISESVLLNNRTALHWDWAATHNVIRDNEVGVNRIATERPFAFNSVYSNTVNLTVIGVDDVVATNNWWGSADPAVIAVGIVDGRDDVSLGLATVAPFLTSAPPEAQPLTNPVVWAGTTVVVEGKGFAAGLQGHVRQGDIRREVAVAVQSSTAAAVTLPDALPTGWHTLVLATLAGGRTQLPLYVASTPAQRVYLPFVSR